MVDGTGTAPIRRVLSNHLEGSRAEALALALWWLKRGDYINRSFSERTLNLLGINHIQKLSLLSVSLRRHATAAAGGSDLDMSKMFARIVIQPDLPARFLPIVYANLDPRRIPNIEMLDMRSPPSDVVLRLSMALLSMEALAFMRSGPSGVYLELWPRVWTWMQLIAIDLK
ncbi:hypothetical protein B0H13DRAFT_2370691 [Mycena leptocephala]|nr:hypothetical protein B0H13DRAFT_2370691 [Mycena leptocephala]